MKTKEFNYTINDEEKTVTVCRPKPKDLRDARLFAGGVFKEAVEKDNPPIVRSKLTDYLKKLGIWNDDKQKRLQELSNLILEGERQLARGGRDKDGNKFTKQQAKELAINIGDWRNEQLRLLMDLKAHDHITLEGILQNSEFDFLVSRCSFIADNPIFKDYNDYTDRQDEDLAYKCADTLSTLMYGEINDKDYPENKFLLKYNFVNENLELVDEQCRRVDRKGRLIDDQGRLINDQGDFVDRDGNKVDKEGNPIEEFIEFED